jgi:hypothetical protein
LASTPTSTYLIGVEYRETSVSPPKFVRPCIPTTAKAIPRGDAWLHEPKLDGYRLQIVKDDAALRLHSKNGYEWTKRLASLADGASDSKYFLRGLVTNLLNPKAGIFYVAVLPTFVTETRLVIGQAIFLSLIYVTIATVVHSAVVLLASVARPWLEDERRSTIVRRALSLLLVGIAVWLFVTTRQIEP